MWEMWEFNYKECWVPKIWCFWTVVLKKILESLLDRKAIQSVHPKGNQSWIFIGRTDAEAETPVLWPLDAKNWLIWKEPDAGKEWRQEEQGMTEDKMVGWYHWLNAHEFEQALRVGDGKGGLVCCLPWGPIVADTAERLNWKVWYAATSHTWLNILISSELVRLMREMRDGILLVFLSEGDQEIIVLLLYSS